MKPLVQHFEGKEPVVMLHHSAETSAHIVTIQNDTHKNPSTHDGCIIGHLHTSLHPHSSPSSHTSSLPVKSNCFTQPCERHTTSWCCRGLCTVIHTFVPDIVVRGLRMVGRVAEAVSSCKVSTCTWPKYSLARGAPVTHSAGERHIHG